MWIYSILETTGGKRSGLWTIAVCVIIPLRTHQNLWDLFLIAFLTDILLRPSRTDLCLINFYLNRQLFSSYQCRRPLLDRNCPPNVYFHQTAVRRLLYSSSCFQTGCHRKLRVMSLYSIYTTLHYTLMCSHPLNFNESFSRKLHHKSL